MKKIISILAIAAIFAACKSNTKTGDEAKVLSSVDTAGLHEFQVLKEQQRIVEQQKMFETQGINDGTNGLVSNTAPVAAAPAVRERIVYVSKPAPAPRRTTTRTTSSSSGGGYSNSGGYGGSSGTVAQVPAKKKGWSKAAKGAVIGAGSGAVLGAVISKNKAKGAIIGGVLGAAGGYVFGRSKDKQDGRY